jgi:hypothetical protein
LQLQQLVNVSPFERNEANLLLFRISGIVNNSVPGGAYNAYTSLATSNSSNLSSRIELIDRASQLYAAQIGIIPICAACPAVRITRTNRLQQHVNKHSHVNKYSHVNEESQRQKNSPIFFNILVCNTMARIFLFL